MTGSLDKYLILHGAIISFIGLFSGLIYWQAIVRNKSSELIRSWRIAHVFLVIEGMFILIAGLLFSHLALSAFSAQLFVWAIISSGYGFVFAFLAGAWTGRRGLTPKPNGLDTVLFIGHFIGAGGSIIAIAMTIYGISKTF